MASSQRCRIWRVEEEQWVSEALKEEAYSDDREPALLILLFCHGSRIIWSYLIKVHIMLLSL